MDLKTAMQIVLHSNKNKAKIFRNMKKREHEMFFQQL